MSRERFCKRVTANAQDFSTKLKDLRSRHAVIMTSIGALEREKMTVQTGVEVYPSTRPGTRRSRRPSGSDVVGLLTQEMDRRIEVSMIEQEIQSRQKEAENIEREINHYKQQLKRQQNEFAQMQCHNLGFSHAIMNLH